MGHRVWGTGYGALGVGHRVWGTGCGAQCMRHRVCGTGCEAQGVRHRVWGTGHGAQGVGVRLAGGFRAGGGSRLRAQSFRLGARGCMEHRDWGLRVGGPGLEAQPGCMGWGLGAQGHKGSRATCSGIICPPLALHPALTCDWLTDRRMASRD